MRPSNWIKNGFLFAPLIFARQFTDASSVIAVLQAFTGFCFLASAVYVLNDIVDIERDRSHPQKRFRPLASGEVQRNAAVWLGLLLTVVGLGMCFALSASVGMAASTYLLLNIAYSFFLKHVVLVDLFAVAANYVIRVAAGALAINAPMTSWLLIASTLLALFLVLGKRRHELVLLGEDAHHHRKILEEYSPYLLDQLIGIVTASTVIFYSLYTFDVSVAENLGTTHLPFTIPFVMYGIFRYLYLIHQKEKGGNPTETLLADRPLLVDVVLWVATVIFLFTWL